MNANDHLKSILDKQINKKSDQLNCHQLINDDYSINMVQKRHSYNEMINDKRNTKHESMILEMKHSLGMNIIYYSC